MSVKLAFLRTRPFTVEFCACFFGGIEITQEILEPPYHNFFPICFINLYAQLELLILPMPVVKNKATRTYRVRDTVGTFAHVIYTLYEYFGNP